MKVIKFKERKDGSVTMTYEITLKEEKMFKDQAKKLGKRFSKKFINDQVLEAMHRDFDK